MRKAGGYLLIDHTASPGLPPAIARQAGYDPAFAKEGKKLEVDTLTCAHCGTSVVPNHFRKRPRETCIRCNHHYVCDVCAFKMTMPDYVHNPIKKLQDTICGSDKQILGSPTKLLMSGD